jgi:nucleotide-binding universal stress UspA family protein
MPGIAVVAVDFGASSTSAARVAMEMLGSFGSLYLVHVEPAFELRTMQVSRGGRDPGEILSRFRNLTAELPQRPGVTVETILLNGNPAKETLEFAESIGAELLAVGTEGTGSCGRFLWEGGARDLVRRSRIPIVAVPSCRLASPARAFAFKKEVQS